jgi:hypothetical protein
MFILKRKNKNCNSQRDNTMNGKQMVNGQKVTKLLGQNVTGQKVTIYIFYPGGQKVTTYIFA